MIKRLDKTDDDIRRTLRTLHAAWCHKCPLGRVQADVCDVVLYGVFTASPEMIDPMLGFPLGLS